MVLSVYLSLPSRVLCDVAWWSLPGIGAMAAFHVANLPGASVDAMAHKRLLPHATRHSLGARQRDGGASNIPSRCGETQRHTSGETEEEVWSSRGEAMLTVSCHLRVRVLDNFGADLCAGGPRFIAGWYCFHSFT